jgi:hypothetical protein
VLAGIAEFFVTLLVVPFTAVIASAEIAASVALVRLIVCVPVFAGVPDSVTVTVTVAPAVTALGVAGDVTTPVAVRPFCWGASVAKETEPPTAVMPVKAIPVMLAGVVVLIVAVASS